MAKRREAARDELVALGFSAVRCRAFAFHRDLTPLLDKVRHPFLGQPKLAADMRVLVGSLLTSVGRIESGAEEAELGKFPVLLLRCFGEGDLPVSFIASFCNDLEEFVVSASDLLDTLDRVLLREKMQSANGAPT